MADAYRETVRGRNAARDQREQEMQALLRDVASRRAVLLYADDLAERARKLLDGDGVEEVKRG